MISIDKVTVISQFEFFLERKRLLEKSSDVAEKENEKKWKAKLVGITLSFLSAFMLLILNTIVKYKKLHFNDVLLVRAVLQTIFGLQDILEF